MIELYEKNTDILLGSISADQLQYLIDQLEEESLEDKDYSITPLLLSAFEAGGADPDLIKLLRGALGDEDEVIIVWRN